MKKRHDNNVRWHNAFQTAIERYWELKGSVGTNACFNYGSLEQEATGKNYNPRVVQMMPIDYICDIELAAYRALGKDTAMAEHFRKYYIRLEDLPEKTFDEWTALDHTIRLKVGREIYINRLHNYNGYMKPKWVDKPSE